MFSKFIKNSFLTLLLLSYASTAIPMEQPNQSWWQRVKNWVRPAVVQTNNGNNQNQDSVEDDQNFQSSSFRARYILYPLLTFLEFLSSKHYRNTGITVANLSTDFQLSKNAIEIIKNTVFKTGVSPDTPVKIEQGTGMVAAGRNCFILDSQRVNKFNPKELEGVIAHECMHLKNNDFMKQVILVAIFPFVSYGILKGYAFGSNYLITRGQKKYCDKNSQMYKWLNTLKKTNHWIGESLLVDIIFNLYLNQYISRYMESRADRQGAQAINSAEGLISAFRKNLEINNKVALKNLTLASLWQNWDFYLWHYFTSKVGLASHPSIQDRIQALQALPMIDKK